jgi:ribosomal protein L10
MDAMEKILDHAGLPPTELQHIRRQLHAVEELMKDIQAETK